MALTPCEHLSASSDGLRHGSAPPPVRALPSYTSSRRFANEIRASQPGASDREAEAPTAVFTSALGSIGPAGDLPPSPRADKRRSSPFPPCGEGHPHPHPPPSRGRADFRCRGCRNTSHSQLSQRERGISPRVEAAARIPHNRCPDVPSTGTPAGYGAGRLDSEFVVTWNGVSAVGTSDGKQIWGCATGGRLRAFGQYCNTPLLPREGSVGRRMGERGT